MNIITSLTSDPTQVFSLVGLEGENISCTLYFKPRMNGWFMDISSGAFDVTGLQIVNSPNILRQWKNVISFGIFVYSIDAEDPQFINDFSSGRIQMYLLSQSEVQEIESNIFD